jgi:hypothetical protein
MCSASKVKCDKTRPICSRCERLGYPCFYSPALRLRKRRCLQSVSSTDRSEGTGNSPDEQQHEATGPARVSHKSNASLSKRKKEASSADLSKHSKEHGSSTQQEFNDTMSNDAPWDFDGAIMTLDDEQASRSSLDPFDFNLPLQHAQSQVNSALAQSPHGNIYADPMSIMDSYPALGGNKPNETIATPYQDSSDGSSNEAVYMDLDNTASPPSSRATESDCAVVAMNILQHLSMTSGQQQCSSNSQLDLNAQFNISSLAIKRVSVILICPCSTRPDVGLLAAAVCASLLDTYEAFLHRSSKPRSNSANPMGRQRRSPSTSLDLSVTEEAGSEKAVVMRILEELPKVANLVMQFGKRYSVDAEKSSKELLQAVAASIRLRLKTMVDEITDWVAQI